MGSPGPSGIRVGYTFTDQWAPRLGVTVDPFGKGKTEAFYNYGGFFEFIPLERSLSVEQDWTGGLFLPEFTTNASEDRIAVINSFGTVNPIIDAAHQIGPSSISAGDPANRSLQVPSWASIRSTSSCDENELSQSRRLKLAFDNCCDLSR